MTAKYSDCINTIKLLAALQVVYGHAIIHMHIYIPFSLNEFLLFFKGVPVFFTLSGYFIWGSIGRSSSFSSYLRKRFWRIYPELWVAVLIELMVIVLLYPATFDWTQFGLFALGQSTLFQFWTPDFLRGYGCGCPNGALWTICVIIQFYVFDYFFYQLMHGRKVWTWVLAVGITIVIGYLTPVVQSYMPPLVAKVYGITFIPYFWMFTFASLLAEYKIKLLPIITKYWYVILALSLCIYYTRFDIALGLYFFLHTITLLGALIGIGYTLPFINFKVDISYGIYIYHMTIINALIVLNYDHGLWALVFTMLSTCLIAWISTKTIGEWSRKMKNKQLVAEHTF